MKYKKTTYRSSSIYKDNSGGYICSSILNHQCALSGKTHMFKAAFPEARNCFSNINKHIRSAKLLDTCTVSEGRDQMRHICL